ncbi:hypothetical protein VCHC50A2_3242A, partial [Vibrio cholerae HC-50A2]
MVRESPALTANS